MKKKMEEKLDKQNGEGKMEENMNAGLNEAARENQNIENMKEVSDCLCRDAPLPGVSGIYLALARVCKGIGFVGKDKKCQMPGANYAYRGIDDVYNAIHDQLGENGIFILPQVLERREEIRQTTKGARVNYVLLKVRYDFLYIDGSHVSCLVIGEAMDMGDKGTNKAMAIAHKYTLLQMFCIPTQDMQDPDAQCEELVPKEPERNGQGKADDRREKRRQEFYSFLKDRFGDDKNAMARSLSSFFRRNIKGTNDLSIAEMDEFEEVVLHG